MDYSAFIISPRKENDTTNDIETRICNMYQEYFLNRVYKDYEAGRINGEELNAKNGELIDVIFKEFKEVFPLRRFSRAKVRGILIKHRLYVSTSKFADPPKDIFNWSAYKKAIVPREIQVMLRYVSSFRKEVEAYRDYLFSVNPEVAKAEIDFLNRVLTVCRIRG
jgi:hypothetical protein